MDKWICTCRLCGHVFEIKAEGLSKANTKIYCEVCGGYADHCSTTLTTEG